MARCCGPQPFPLGSAHRTCTYGTGSPCLGEMKLLRLTSIFTLLTAKYLSQLSSKRGLLDCVTEQTLG